MAEERGSMRWVAFRSINGAVPEERQHAFWVRASKRYYALAVKLERWSCRCA
jgi:hypothetical protein